jgi:hypothetical protein
MEDRLTSRYIPLYLYSTGRHSRRILKTGKTVFGLDTEVRPVIIINGFKD